MSRFSASLACAAGSLILLSGCLPANDTHTDEQNDPHYLRGRALVSSQDFRGAVAEFEQALESNPHSASAHFQLGWLYEEKMKDPAAAIYHYQRQLSLQPASPNSEAAKGRIRACKRELADIEFPLPITQNLQRDVDRLTAENQLLKQQMETLKGQLAAAEAAAQARPAAPVYSGSGLATAAPAQNSSVTTARPRVHVVKSRETIASIAQQYSVKPNAILAANPKVDPRRLRVGQTINLP